MGKGFFEAFNRGIEAGRTTLSSGASGFSGSISKLISWGGNPWESQDLEYYSDEDDFTNGKAGSLKDLWTGTFCLVNQFSRNDIANTCGLNRIHHL